MKLDRLIGILTVLLQNDRVTAPYLVEKTDIIISEVANGLLAIGNYW